MLPPTGFHVLLYRCFEISFHFFVLHYDWTLSNKNERRFSYDKIKSWNLLAFSGYHSLRNIAWRDWCSGCDSQRVPKTPSYETISRVKTDLFVTRFEIICSC
jgi:hypothetical protein